MERLTCPAQGYCEMYCKEYGRCFGEPETCDFSKEVQLYEKLRDYEQSRLEPLEVRILAQADRDGRLVVLPCSPGAELTKDGETFKADHWNVSLTAFKEEPGNRSGLQVAVFSTEEAEAALKGGGDHGKQP